MIVLAGLAVGGGHLLSTTRRWINEMGVPPSELARMKWTPGQGRDVRRGTSLAERVGLGSRASGV